MDAGEDETARTIQSKYRVLDQVFTLASAQPPPVGFLTAAIVVGLIVGVVGHVVHARLMIFLGIVIVGAVCGYVVVSSYVGAFG
jgi:hypothetical protein